MTIKVKITHAHFFCGLGGGAQGFNEASARVGNLEAEFVCLGGIDVDLAAIRDFQRATRARGTVMDLFTRTQYIAFHGHEPPPGWREATTDDIRAAFNHRRPDIGFTSSPCKGLSGLLNETKSQTPKYQALNELTLRGIWLMCETYKDDPIPLIIFENVPRIASRGRPLLDQINAVLSHYGYAVAETTHDCGEIGGLAQSRKRLLLVARHVAKVPAFLYEPPKRFLRSVGEVLGRIPLPGDPAAGPMHRIPALQWKTWVRLAFVEAGGDWRSLHRLRVKDGNLADYLIVPEYRTDYLGVTPWEQASGTITSRGGPTNGRFAIADPRMPPSDTRHYNLYRVVEWTKPSQCIIGANHVGGGALSVAHPRRVGPPYGSKYGVTKWNEPTGTVIGGSTTGHGAYAVADPRPAHIPQKGDPYLTGGHYGVLPWERPSGAISAAACHDNGRFSVADPRVDEIAALPAPADKLIAIIRALDGSWHRPLTTLDMAALQSLYDPDDYAEGEIFDLHGTSDEAKRERIGNAVPRFAARAIGSMMGQTLLLAMSGETFQLSATPIWVRPVAIARSVDTGMGRSAS
jgi:site-specific DNA-cytosine methylase